MANGGADVGHGAVTADGRLLAGGDVVGATVHAPTISATSETRQCRTSIAPLTRGANDMLRSRVQPQSASLNVT